MKRLSILLFLIIFVLCLGLTAAAETAPQATLRIEGINENLFYSKVEIGNAQTLAQLIINVDASHDGLTVVGAENSYITDINGDAAGHFGGWDGWSYAINGTIPSVGIGDISVCNGDEIVIFYADAFGVGIQRPVMDTSKISEGVITFTSTDIIYDENFNPSTVVNPVADMKVIFNDTELITDKQGSVTIPKQLLTPGDHSISVSKTDQNGLPLVLRLPPNATVSIPQPTPDQATDDNSDNSGSAVTISVITIALAVIAIAIYKKNKK